ncbi:DNA cytosine methyltransferase [Enterovibrio norvegicus]|uniref:DNA cytosine methyltransferase n=1 Tax=Enterovibrio norvegicus TaxID=188144 RepID=UPI000C82003C|nr:DNA cytosine methyltransferase [Enterovibrio norvegicus]PMN68393.1 DNA methyltransferase [Enterovibrio norvegicus]
MIHANELVVDNFAGGGGASTGMELGLNRHVDIAINHDPEAIAMHKANHPETRHYCESVWDVDPVEACEGRPVGLAWFSPDCKHFSKAKGSRPVDKNIRGLAWVAVRWAALVPVRVFMLENVEEFMTWGPLLEVAPGQFKPDPQRKGETFKAFIQCLSTGLDSAHPAWEEIRTALGDGFPYHMLEKGLGYNIEHRVLSACDFGVPTTRKRFFLVARNDGAQIQWPEQTHGDGLKPYRTAAEIIDWSIPVKSIFGRKRPLAENTMKRIAKGLEKFVFNADEPFIVPEQAAIPFITEHANASGQRNMALDEPLRTLCAQVKGGHFALVTSHVIKMRGTNLGHGAAEPLHTISAGGLHLGEVRAFLVKYYGTSHAGSCNSPLDTVTTKDRFGLVTVHGEEYQIIDIGMRMLEPHELYAAHDFPATYKISHDMNGKKLTKRAQVARVGNSVPPTMARVLVNANVEQPLLSEIAA